MKIDITCCVVNFNAINALKLTHQSFLAHHSNINATWLVWDNGSTDGAQLYASQFAKRLYIGDNKKEHGICLDALCRAVETEYTMVMDNDIEFLAPVVEDAVALIKAGRQYVSWPCLFDRESLPECQMFGFTLKSQIRIVPCCAVFKTAVLKHALETLSWGTYVQFQQQKFYDTGGMLRSAFHLRYGGSEPAWMRERVKHYGSISSLFRGEDPANEYRQKCYDEITERLKCYSPQLWE